MTHVPIKRFEQAAARAGADLTAQSRYSSFDIGRYQLPNGLVVLIAHDPRADVFAYHTWMRVGSKHENPDQTGLAHLMEHLMFKATRNQPLGAFDRQMEERGAQTNAATWVDWTYYHQTLAHRNDNLSTVAQLEADRLTQLVLDEDTFASELSVVQNERRMTVDDSVLGALCEAVYGTAFTQHGYRWPTIGYAKHLERSTLEDILTFYRRHYAPDRAVVVVAGRVDPVETMSIIQKAYDKLEPSGFQTPPCAVEPDQVTERRVEISRPTHTRYLVLAYRIPEQVHPARTGLDAATELLLVGDNARLYQALVTEARLASDVEGALTPFADSGLCEISITLRPDVDVDQVLACVDREIEALPASLNPSLLDKVKNGLELGFYESLRDADELAESLGHFEVTQDDFSLAFDAPQKVGLIDLDAIAEATRTWLRPQRRTVGVVNPA